MVAVALGLFLLRVSLAPIAVPFAAFAAERLSVASGTQVEVGEIAVHLSAKGPTLTLREVSLSGAGVRAFVPSIRLRQTLSGRTLAVRGANLRLDPAAQAAASGPPPTPREIIESLAGGSGRFAAALEAFGVRLIAWDSGRLDIVPGGRPLGHAKVFRDLSGAVRVEEDRLAVEARARGTEGEVRVSLTRAPATADGETLTLSARGLTPSDLLNLEPVRSGFPLVVSASAGIGADGAVGETDIAIEIGAGTVRFGNDPPRRLDSGALALAIREDGRVAIPSADFVAGGSDVRLSGAVRPADGGVWRFAFEPRSVWLDAPEAELAPIEIVAGRAEGALDLAGRRLDLERLTARTADGSLFARVSFDLSNQGPAVSGAIAIPFAPLESLKRAWPAVVAHGARVALNRSTRGGYARDLTAELALPRIELDGKPETLSDMEGFLALDATFVATTFVTPDVDASVAAPLAQVRIRDRAIAVVAPSATVPLEDGSGLALSDASLTVRNLAARPAFATVEADLSGSLESVARIAKRLGLAKVRGVAVEPEAVTGRLEADVAATVAFGEGAEGQTPEWAVDARLTDAGSTQSFEGRVIGNANVEVVANNRRLAARGSATIDGLPIDVNYSEVFAKGSSGAARFVLTDAERRARGFDTGALLRGPVLITLSQSENDTRTINADLAEASLTSPIFRKDAGTPLTASATVRTEADRIWVEDLHVHGGDVSVTGGAELVDGRPRRVHLDSFALSEGDEATLTVEAEEDGALAVALSADAFDLSALRGGFGEAGEGAEAERGDGSGDGSDGPLIRLAADIARASLGEDAALADVKLRAVREGGQIPALDLTGRVAGESGSAFALTLGPAAGDAPSDLSAEVEDLGTLLRAAKLYRRMSGGRAVLRGRVDEDDSAAGQLQIRNFSLRDDERFNRIVRETQRGFANEAGNQGDVSAFARTPPPNALEFSELTVDFAKAGQRIDVKEAILRGPLLGGTASGTIDLEGRTIDIAGTFIPAYGVNNLFGRVPLIGEILGGGETGGLIGVTFRLSGPIAGPALTVNPVSAIAPGIFRRIFEFR